MSLKSKIILLVLAISSIAPLLAGYIIYRNSLSTAEYQMIADRSLPRTREMGETLFNFRQVRVQVRSLAIRGNTPADNQLFLDNIKVALKDFHKTRDELLKMMNTSPEELAMATKMNESWKLFEEFGGEVLALANKGDEASLNKMAEMIRLRCHVLAKPVESAIEDMFAWQTARTQKRVEEAQVTADNTKLISLILVVVSVCLSVIFGLFFANNLVKTLAANVFEIGESVKAIHQKSEDVALVAGNLSNAATQQASGLQETVTSIDEISAMIARNSDSAVSSTKISENSKHAAQKGKERAQKMMDSINAISEGNNELLQQVQKSNREISEIVTVINEIASKTEVINDIVFQTKLLSFNASVEAARAGEHGKGFAVVAEEVGNLASMSGKAANEISGMLSKSVTRVTDIVNSTKTMMDSLISQSKSKIDSGTLTAQECSRSLDEILTNVTTVNEMIKEISTASMEQSSGVNEVNKAMGQLDQITQQNAASAESSDKAASELNSQVEKLNMIVSQLSNIVTGSGDKSPEQPEKRDLNNVVSLKSAKVQKAAPQYQSKKVVGGLNGSAPVSNDPRFEEV